MTERVLLDHGTGGVQSRRLISEVLVAELGAAHAGSLSDSTIVVGCDRLAMTTDSFIVQPLFFGGGDIGKLAVCGTVNDLAVSGARPAYLTLAVIVEEGFLLSDLREIFRSISRHATAASVKIVAGDTKVMPKGALDGIILNTAGVGLFDGTMPRLGPERIAPGDSVVVSGQLGNHGLHILSLREGLGFETRVPSDCAPLNELTAIALREFGDGVKFMRDVTRGGLATVLDEVIDGLSLDAVLQVDALPVSPEMTMGCDMLDIDPLHLANEGCVMAVVSSEVAEALAKVWRAHVVGAHACVVGQLESGPGRIYRNFANGDRIPVAPLDGRVLARLC
jgi:hydrogenase expression/formation protein HypE